MKSKQRDIVNNFETLLDKYMEKNKYHLCIVRSKDEETIRQLKIFEQHKDNPMWIWSIYSACHTVNTIIMYPFIKKLYPHIQIVQSCIHTFIADITTKKFYDLSMLSEVLGRSFIDEFIITIPTYLLGHYTLHNDANFLIQWRWFGYNDIYLKALDLCRNKYI